MLNYGASTNWAFARIGAMTGSNEESSLEAFGRAMRGRRWVENVASDTEVAGILDRLTQGLNEGGIGNGILNAYAPGAGVQELTAVCQLAATHAVPTFTHVAYMSRIDPESPAEAYIRLIGYATATGAHMHICHFNSSSKADVERCAVLVGKAQAQGNCQVGALTIAQQGISHSHPDQTRPIHLLGNSAATSAILVCERVTP